MFALDRGPGKSQKAKVKVQKAKALRTEDGRPGTGDRRPGTAISFSQAPVPRPQSPVASCPPLKILHVIPSVGPLRGGPSQVVQTLANGLAAAGVEVHVATTDDNGPGRLAVPYGEPVRVDGVSYWYFPRQGHFYTVSLPLGRWLARHIPDYDVVHIHALFSYAPLAAAFWAWRHRVPYLVRPAGLLNQWGMRHRRPWLKGLVFRVIDSRILAGAAMLHYTSDQEWREATTLGVGGKHVVIPNPVATPPELLSDRACRFRAQYPQLADRIMVLFLARLDEKKGVDLLLEAFAQARQQCPQLVLVIAGEGPPLFVATLQRRVHRLGIEAEVIWTGFLAGEAKWGAFGAADIFVLPSYSENFGMAVVEAMAVGRPVLVTDQVGIHAAIADAQAGLVTPCAVSPLADALVRLASDAEGRERMGRNGQVLVREQFSLPAVTHSLLGLYTNIRQEKTTPRAMTRKEALPHVAS